MIDITDQKFNRLTAIKYSHRKQWHYYWVFRCECGTEKPIRVDQVKSGTTKSCGCLNKELYKTRNVTHGMSKTNIYRAWVGMVDRCSNIKNSKYGDYGGRGITVCDRWLTFVNFFQDMGGRPFQNAEIDRINNNGNYEPNNCKWSTRTEQNRNKRDSAKVTFNGETKCLSEWAIIYNIDRGTLRSRLHRGWSFERSTTGPLIY